MPKFLLCFLFGLNLLYCPGTVRAERQHTSINAHNASSLNMEYQKDWEEVDAGIRYKKVTIISDGSRLRTVLKFIRLDPMKVRVKIIFGRDLGFADGFFVRNIARKNRAALIVNGSYFDLKRNPLGFLVRDGKAINKRVVTNWIYSGLFYMTKGKPFLIHSGSFPSGMAVDQALQAGPLLIKDGKAVKDIKHTHASHFRSGIGLTRENKILVFATDTKYGGISWFELQQVLLGAGLDCVQAMNLDGGGSTQMALTTKRKKEVIDGTSRVPVAIGFFKKDGNQ